MSDLKIIPFCEDYSEQVRDLFVRVNRQLAPEDLKDAFETYISLSLKEEILRIADYYGEKLGGFWIAIRDQKVIGMFGLERISNTAMELRRMYVDPKLQRQGIAKAMLKHAEDECRARGFAQLELSTSELQPAALSLYKSSGYELVREDVSVETSVKMLGKGIRRFYFSKRLG